MSGPVLFAEHLHYLLKVVEGLNALPQNDVYYVHAELRDGSSHEKVAVFSDEISSDDWSVDFDVERLDDHGIKSNPVEDDAPEEDVRPTNSAEAVLERVKQYIEHRTSYLTEWAKDPAENSSSRLRWTERLQTLEAVASVIEMAEEWTG